MNELGVNVLEIRNNPIVKLESDILQEGTEKYFTSILDLTLGNDKLWSNLNKKRRNSIRKSMNNSFLNS